ncbi:hypothetical protein ACHELR_000685 [Vibrio fluvialis]
MKNKLTDLCVENFEIAFDSLFESGVLKDIPLLGNIVNALRLKEDVKNYLFAKKLESFLVELKSRGVSEITPDLCDDEKLGKIGQDIVFIIDRASSIDKSKWIARAVIGLTEDKYDVNEFERIIYVIDKFTPSLRATMGDIYQKRELKNGRGYVNVINQDLREELANLGLLRRRYEAKVSNDGFIPVAFETCPLGLYFWEVIENS